MMLAVVMIALLAQSQGYIWSNYISKGYSPSSRYCRLQFGIEMEITSIIIIIICAGVTKNLFLNLCNKSTKAIN